MDEAIGARLAAVEAELAIRNLVTRYTLVMDDRDVAAIPGLFTREARMWTGDGRLDAGGRDALVALYEGRFAVLGASCHLTHGAVIEIEGADTANGVVTSTAEVWRNGRHQLASIRYCDRYAHEDGAWRIAERNMLYFYYVAVEEHAGILATRLRNRTYEAPLAADVPEATAPFRAYKAARAGGTAPGARGLEV
jgi:hypothetical protein